MKKQITVLIVVFIFSFLSLIILTTTSAQSISYLEQDICFLREAEQKEVYGKVIMPIESLCYQIEGTPAWAKEGEIVDYGYKGGDAIPTGYFFYYNIGCSWCQKQVKDFGQQYFTELKERGYAIDCTN